MSSGAPEYEKHPIYPVEIEKYRDRITIGQRIRIRIESIDLDFKKITVHRLCTVVEKHRWLFVVTDSRGRKYAGTYIEQIIQGRSQDG